MYRPKKLVGLVLMFLCLAKLLHGAGSFDGLTADVTRGQTVYGSGWACGYDQGAPVNYVFLYLDGGYYGNADLGGYRPDVQNANASYGGWSYQDITYSGWSFPMGTGNIAPGSHYIDMYAVSSNWEYVNVYDDYYEWQEVDSWEYLGRRYFTVHGVAPVAQSVSSNNCDVGGAVTLSGRATHSLGELQWMDFYVSGPTLPGWNHVGGAWLSGGDFTGQLSWKPPMPGDWLVHMRARTVSHEWDNEGRVSGFTVSEPVTAPSSPQNIYPGELTLARVGDVIHIPQYSEWVNDDPWGYYQYYNGYIKRTHGYDGWDYLGNYVSFTAAQPGLYEVEGGGRVYVLHPASPPSATIWADSTTIALGQSTTIRANFSAGSYDRLINTNIDSPEGYGLPGLDSGQPTDKTYTFTPSGLGYQVFYARIATVNFGWSTYGAVGVNVIDATPPSTPGGLYATGNTSGSGFNLNWSASSDNVSVTAYEVALNGGSLGSTGSTSLYIGGLQQAATYSMQVRARDAAGNWSSWSGALPVTTPDVSAPSIPGGLSVANNTTGTSFTLNWGASSDNVGVSAYEVRRNGSSLGTTGATSIAMSGLAQVSTYSLEVRACDAAGNWSGWATALSVTTPDVSAPSVPSGLGATNNTSGTNFTLTWSASSDNVAVTAYEVLRNGGSLGTTTSSSIGVSGLTFSTTYSMQVRARDAAGNWSGWSSALPVIASDVTPPAAPSSLGNSTPAETSFTLTWNTSTDAVRYQVYKDGSPLSAANLTATSYAVNGLTAGTVYQMQVKAFDAASNDSGLSAARAVATAGDTTPPTAPFGLSNTAPTETAFTLTWSGPADAVRYQVYKNGSPHSADNLSTTSYQVSALTAGTVYQMQVKAFDAVGNGSDLSAVRSVTTAAIPVITSVLNATCTLGSPYSYAIAATHSPTSYSASGLPSGLTCQSNTGVISGTPTQSGVFNIGLSANNGDGAGTATLALVVENVPVPVINSVNNVTAFTGAAFSYQISATNSPSSYNAVGLPSGLSVNTSTGVVSGVPSQDGTFNVTIHAINAGGTGSSSLIILVLGPGDLKVYSQ